MFYDRLIENWDSFVAAFGEESLREKRINSLTWDDVHSLLEEAVVINVDNVAQFLFEKIGHRHFPSLPNIRPVFPVVWFEWQTQPIVGRMAVYQKGGVVSPGFSLPFHTDSCLVFTNQENDDFIEMACISFRESKHSFVFVGLEIWECQLDGQLIRSFPLSEYLQEVLAHIGTNKVLPPAYVPMLATSFIHCKNTVLEVINPPDRLNHARSRRGKHPLVSYRVLDVRPGNRILETEGRINEVGLKKALHICRGHFKDYTEKGLFGKLHGLYWWSPYVRGDIREGIALKDYRVHTN